MFRKRVGASQAHVCACAPFFVVGPPCPCLRDRDVAKILPDPYLIAMFFSDKYRDAVNPFVPACVAAFVRALYPEATMFSIDPEEM